jgi:hypothetical protein
LRAGAEIGVSRPVRSTQVMVRSASQVAMDDALVVRDLERGGDLAHDRQRTVERADPTVLDELVERRALHQLHRDGIALEAVDLRDIGVVQRREHPGFALEAREALEVAREDGRQHLDGDVAAELEIMGAIDLAHSAFAKFGGDLEDPDAGARSE